MPARDLDKNGMIKKITARCSEALTQAMQGNRLHFASEHTQEFAILRPEPLVYDDEDKKYQILNTFIDDSKQWSKFPKRHSSIVCSTSKQPANRKHTVYVVLPFNGAKLAMCPDDDFFTSFNHMEQQFGVKDAYEFEQRLRQLFIAINEFVHDSKEIETDAENIKKYCAMFDNIMKAVRGSYEFKLFYEESTGDTFSRWQKIANLYEAISETIDPEINDFEVIKISELNSRKNHEVWFSTECYIVEQKVFESMIDSGKLAHMVEVDKK